MKSGQNSIKCVWGRWSDRYVILIIQNDRKGYSRNTSVQEVPEHQEQMPSSVSFLRHTGLHLREIPSILAI